jgi:hypothetical protein
MLKKEVQIRRDTVANLVAMLTEKSPYYAIGYLESLLKSLVVRNDECYEYIADTALWLEVQE